ncbi:hypothetical protein BJV82DRAFT_600853 [Fennellomyces sp. T-0311]|nr:hypothetical protein BJV82DRAFT_600853 [Fennellomyces sp. T-0311]
MKLLPIQVTTKRQRKRWHANRRDFAREQGWEQNDLPTIAFYGAGDMPLIPGFAPIPHVVQGTYIHCPHIIKRRRALTLAGNRGRKVKWCVDGADVFLHPQADCEQGQARSRNLVHKAMQERACSRASSCKWEYSCTKLNLMLLVVVCRQRQERSV